MARLSERDARAWHGLAQRIGQTIEPRLSPWVLANRGPVALRPLSIASTLRRARSAAHRLASSTDLVLRTDVRSFYASVTPSIAFRSLVDLAVEREVATRTSTMLEGWGSEGYEGLPIGPPGSAVIANAVLASVDSDLWPLPFLRWVDDYLIAAEERQLPLLVERLDESLSRVGLERSAPKTEAIARGAPFVWPGAYLRDNLADRELEDVGRPL